MPRSRTREAEVTTEIPGAAIDADEKDVVFPTRVILEDLNLLPTDDDMQKADGGKSTFAGAPQSVAVIEAGATAFSKWWATGLGAGVIATWGGIRLWWSNLDTGSQHVTLWAASIGAAAAILAIGYIVGSDLRGRATAAVATIEARAKISDTVIRMAEAAYKPIPAAEATQLITLPTPLHAIHTTKPGDEEGWKAIAFKTNGGSINEYFLVKDNRSEWVSSANAKLGDPVAPS